MRNDDFLEDAVLRDKYRPLPGHVLCLKETTNQEVEVEGLGTVSASDITDSGLVLVSKDTKQAETVKALTAVVVALGNDPYKWETRWQGDAKKLRDWETTWEEQKVEEGTVVAIRAISGMNQERDSRFLDLKYNEISMIGQPHDIDCPDMLPAPNWVMLELDVQDDQMRGSLHLYAGLQPLLDHGNMIFGVVRGLPRGYIDGDLSIGDRVCVPAHTGVGATEFVEFEGNLRAVPMDDIMGVVEDGRV